MSSKPSKPKRVSERALDRLRGAVLDAVEDAETKIPLLQYRTFLAGLMEDLRAIHRDRVDEIASRRAETPCTCKRGSRDGWHTLKCAKSAWSHSGSIYR